MRVKDHVVHVRVRKHEKTQHALHMELGLGSATLLQLAFLDENDPNLPWEKFPLGQQSVQNIKYKKTKKKQKNHLGPGHFIHKNVHIVRAFIQSNYYCSHTLSTYKLL